MIKKVEEADRPLKKGEEYLVPCIVTPILEGKKKFYITPVLNHPHDDPETNQNHFHYHVDYRFIILKETEDIGSLQYYPGNVSQKDSRYHFVENYRITQTKDTRIEYILLPVIREEFIGITNNVAIQNKHKGCKNTNKCPHKGFDLSQVPIVNGCKTCPLHGTKIEFTEVKSDE